MAILPNYSRDRYPNGLTTAQRRNDRVSAPVSWPSYRIFQFSYRSRLSYSLCGSKRINSGVTRAHLRRRRCATCFNVAATTLSERARNFTTGNSNARAASSFEDDAEISRRARCRSSVPLARVCIKIKVVSNKAPYVRAARPAITLIKYESQ